MGLVAQGTVQVKQAGRKTVVLINPISDYRVRHKAKDGAVKLYTIFVGDDDLTTSLPVENTYEIDDSLSDALREAAFSQTKIQVEIEKKDRSGKIVGVSVPADSARHSDAAEH